MAVESSVVSGIAGRYATALFELAREAEALDAVAADLAGLAAMIAESGDLQRLVRSPSVGRAEQLAAMMAVLERAGSGDLVRRFVGVLAANRRLFVIGEAIRAYQRRLAGHRGEQTVEVAAAAALSPDQMKSLRAALARVVGREVAVETRIAPELIGGLVVKLGSRVYDASVRNKLMQLEASMRRAG